jgi:hypothetical protein
MFFLANGGRTLRVSVVLEKWYPPSFLRVLCRSTLYLYNNQFIHPQTYISTSCPDVHLIPCVVVCYLAYAC